MTTKQRAYLKSLAMKIEPIFQIGKSSMSPGLTEAVSEALEARELIAGRTRSQVVQVIGKKIVLYREGKDDKKKIILPL